jgi:phospholipid/cholesterol/gamma-HCH transport system substrate-binding protein
MDKLELMKKLAAGLFFILGIIIFVVVVMTIGRDKGLGQKQFSVDVLFSNVGGLSEGAPVRLNGVSIGTVRSIEFLENNFEGRRVKVTVNILEKFRGALSWASRFTIQTEGILGEKIVEIYEGDASVVVDKDKPILGEEPMDIQSMAVIFSEAARSFTKTADQLAEIDIIELADIMSESSKGLLETSQVFNSLFIEFQELSDKSKRLMNRVEQKVIDGNLFKVF